MGFVRFENRNGIKRYIPISFFSGLEKRSGMLVHKGETGCWGLFEKREVRYQVPKKVGFRGDEVVSLQQWMKKPGFQLFNSYCVL